MNLLSPPVIASFLAPALALMLLLSALARWCRLKPRGWNWCLGCALVSLGLLLTPMDGLPLARCLAGVIDHWSLPSLALLLSAVAPSFLGLELLRPADRRAAWIFAAVTGAVLYPLALGWGLFDPYTLGWCFGPLFVAILAVTLFLLWRGNRFGIVLVLALAAWLLGLPESGNYWDCLLDPLYFLASLVALALAVVKAPSRPHPAT